jgi:hypothetical protein
MTWCLGVGQLNCSGFTCAYNIILWFAMLREFLLVIPPPPKKNKKWKFVGNTILLDLRVIP